MTDVIALRSARRALRFTFDGRALEGREGDTLAAALLANGVRLVGRSFKYHRPRGLFSAGVEEPNALVTIDRGAGRVTPNLQATQVELYEGLVARSQNRWPSLRHDVMELNDLASELMPAGFYYKTFMWPAGAWRKLYEPLIRRAAGFGAAPREPDPDDYANRYVHCETLVVGSGPAGLAAALAASETGERVILCEQDFDFGGALLVERAAMIDGAPAADWLRDALGALRARPNVRLLNRTTAFGLYAQNYVCLVQRCADHKPPAQAQGPRERLWQARARRVIVAAGAIERPMVFENNDRPGVMLADAARVYANRFGIAAGRRALVACVSDSAWRAALEAQAAGVEIALIADARAQVSDALVEAARAAGAPFELGARVRKVHGRLAVEAADVETGAGVRRVACDLVLMGAGWTPTLHLYAQARGALAWDEALGAFRPREHAPHLLCVGGANGTLSLAGALDEGAAAGGLARVHAVEGDWPFASAWSEPVAEGPAFVDFQNDVKARDFDIAQREGFASIEHVKRFTTSGLGTDQGKTGAINATRIVAQRSDRAPQAVGVTTLRPPFTPVSFGALAHMGRGETYAPARETPSHASAAALGAAFENAGPWKRARFFPRPGESEARTITREAMAVRAAAGLFDASTLGKIEVVGPDALAFLNKIYVNDFTRLAPGRSRYGLMLNEAGFVMDDGVVARLAEDRFHLTTTTSGLAHALHHMEDFLQTEFTQMRVWLVDVTERWACFAVQGPRAREILAPLVAGVDLAREAVPHMSVREGAFMGVPLRLMRTSFSGELGFEVNVPADHGAAAWDLLLERGAPLGLEPYGLEALDVLRAEKGYPIIGQDSDGSCTPDDLGLSRLVGAGKGDFVGARSLRLAHLAAPGRRRLVGLRVRSGRPLEIGAQVMADATRPAGAAGPLALGHVTTSRFSPVLGAPIALALVADGAARMGARVFVTRLDGPPIEAEIAPPAFYDPTGARLHA